jgi:hypothetical protein
MKKLLIFLSIACASINVDAGTLNTVKGALIFRENVEGVGEVKIEFANCMANNLYTFKSVSIDGETLNATGSDNIGPFLIDSGWVGGNHVNNNVKSAKTVSVKVCVDGVEIDRTQTASYQDCKVVDIEVVNNLYLPGQEPSLFAVETMTYKVAGNSIEVIGEHEYKSETPIRIDRYYGMQSMFIDETEILTPGGAYSRWTPIAEVSRFTKESAPEFCTYVEHSEKGYQASYLMREGLGDHGMVSDSDWVFIGNSSAKSYHKIIGDRIVNAGDRTMWHGVYSWFINPIVDECGSASEKGVFAYKGWQNGEETEFRINADGSMSTITAGVGKCGTVDCKGPFARECNGGIVIDAEYTDACCYTMNGVPIHYGSGTFECPRNLYILNDGFGNVMKLLVR